MSHLETLLRETFTAHEVDVPDVPELAMSARSRAGRDARRGRLIAAGAALAVTVLVAAVAVLARPTTDRPAIEAQRVPGVRARRLAGSARSGWR